MDIETRLRLRTFVKPDVTPLLKLILVALVIHIFLWTKWTVENNTTVAELPEWVNIKLVAGFESKDEKAVKAEKQHKPEIKKSRAKPIENTLMPGKAEKKNIPKNKVVKKAQATTLISADSRPYSLENPKPFYPSAARRRGMQGVVLLSVEISEKGRVNKIGVLKTSGFSVLDRSAVKSVKRWRFIPAKRGERNVSSQMEIPIRFVLKI